MQDIVVAAFLASSYCTHPLTCKQSEAERLILRHDKGSITYLLECLGGGDTSTDDEHNARHGVTPLRTTMYARRWLGL